MTSPHPLQSALRSRVTGQSAHLSAARKERMQTIKGIGMICAVIVTLMFRWVSAPFSRSRCIK